eukprot:1547676-Prymnesium_polylepis.1
MRSGSESRNDPVGTPTGTAFATELVAAADVARPRTPASCVCSASAAAASPSPELSNFSIAIATCRRASEP